MAFCKNCGAQMEEGVTFCANCGSSVEQAQPQFDATGSFAAQPQFDAQPQFNAQPQFDAQPQFNAQPQFAPQQPAYGYQQPQQPAYGYQQPQQPAYGYQQPQQPAYGYQQPQQPTYGYQTMGTPVGTGLGKAITSCILAFLGFIFGYISLSYAVISYYGEYFAIAFIFFAAALALSIVGLVLGTKSIGAFKDYKRQTGRSFVGTLICGIAGIVEGATGILFALIAFINILSWM